MSAYYYLIYHPCITVTEALEVIRFFYTLLLKYLYQREFIGTFQTPYPRQ